MKLLRILTLDNIKHHRRVFTVHIGTKQNSLADALSRLDFKRFWKNAPKSMNTVPDNIHPGMLSLTEIWNNEITYLDKF